MEIVNKIKRNNGVTLLSLIVTIIVLLILAGVTLGTLFSDDGVIEKANSAASRYNQAKDDEEKYLGSIANELDKYNGIYETGTTKPSGTPSDTTTPSQTPDPTPTPEKQEGRLTLSPTSGTIVYPNEGIFTVEENTSGGTLSVSSSDDSVASATVSGNVVTIIPKEIQVNQKQVVITVKSAETTTHKEKTATYIATIKQGGITLEATVTTRQYNGTAFDAITSVSVTPTDAKVEYSLDNGAYSGAIPKITDAGEYTVAIRATKAGYETKEITKKVTISKQTSTTGNLTLSGTSGTITYPHEGTFTITSNVSGGELSVSSSDTSVATASLSGQIVTIVPAAVTESGKTATITVTSKATNNYEAQTATYIVTVNQGEITISANAYSGTVDGQVHDAVMDVSVVPTDATVTYSLDVGAYSSTIPQVSSAGTYTVKIKAVREGYAEKEIEKTVNIASLSVPPEEGWTIEQAKAIVKSEGLQAHIGDKVQYNPTAGGTWRIFYYDTEDDGNGNGYFGELNTLYLKRDYVGKNTELKSHESHTPSDGGTLMKKMNPKWTISSSGNSIDLPSEHAVSWLCDPVVWASNYKIDGVADYTIGSPSVEMYMKAYNVYKDNNPNSTTLVNKIENINGYSIGAKDTYYNSGYYTVDNAIESGPNNVFMTEGSNNWWIASPSAYLYSSTYYTICIWGSKARVYRDSHGAKMGVCPIAAISNLSDVKTEPPEVGWTVEEAKELVARDGLKAHLGEKVQYNPTEDSTGVYRIFYYDNEPNSTDSSKGYFGDPLGTLYLKRDYVSKDTKLNSYTTYNPLDNGATMKKMNPKWAGSTAHNPIDQENEHCVAWLCDPSKWTKYKVEGVAEYAIGSPSVEMFMKAYGVYKEDDGDPDRNSTALVCKLDDTNRKLGYLVGANNDYSANSGYYTANNTIEAGPENIFVPSDSYEWWCLSSPAAYKANYILRSLGQNTNVGVDTTGSTYGVCPIISISQ